MNEQTLKRIIFTALSVAISVIPTVIAILVYFPIWKEDGAKVLSGVCLLLLAIAIRPAVKCVKKFFQSPASYTVWFILFILFFTLSKIAEDMTVISLIGFLSNILGAVIYKISRKYGETNEN